MSECTDCKYYADEKCGHPYKIHCMFCSLWTPKRYGMVKKSLLYADLDEIIDATDGKGEGE